MLMEIYVSNFLFFIKLIRNYSNIFFIVAIGRRLQDPLLEYVKIEPKHLGVGMYQVRVFFPYSDDLLKEPI